MLKFMQSRVLGGHAAGRRWGVTVLVTTVAALGCSDILDVELPGAVSLGLLSDPALAPLLVTSAQNDYECALADKITWDGLWTGTLNNASTHNPLGSPRSRRLTAANDGNSPCGVDQVRGTSFAPFGALKVALGQARQAYEIISGHPDNLANKQALLAKAAAFQGYATLMVTEGYCEMRLEPDGPILPRNDGVLAAAALFATAITHATAANNSALLNLARVGRARALIYVGGSANAAAAKALAEQVPGPANPNSLTGAFVYNATYDASPPRRHNKVYAENDPNAHTSVHPSFRTNDPADPQLKVGGVNDPRVPVVRNASRAANDGVTPMWSQRLYTSPASPIPMAKWQEAQLIIAEAELVANNAAAAVAAIDRVRAAYGVPLYATDPGGAITVDAVRTQLIEERRREFFLQGHRLGDMLRFNQPFEEGVDPKGQPFTTGSTCIQLPDYEK